LYDEGDLLFHLLWLGGYLVSGEDVGQFDKAEMISVHTGAKPDGPTISMYQVDLRELELKVARTAFEAEKAKRELLEARLRAPISSSQGTDAYREESKR